MTEPWSPGAVGALLVQAVRGVTGRTHTGPRHASNLLARESRDAPARCQTPPKTLSLSLAANPGQQRKNRKPPNIRRAVNQGVGEKGPALRSDRRGQTLRDPRPRAYSPGQSRPGAVVAMPDYVEIFNFSFRRSGETQQTAFLFEVPSWTTSCGRPLTSHRRWLSATWMRPALRSCCPSTTRPAITGATNQAPSCKEWLADGTRTRGMLNPRGWRIG